MMAVALAAVAAVAMVAVAAAMAAAAMVAVLCHKVTKERADFPWLTKKWLDLLDSIADLNK